jgi:predicted GTPase
MSQKKRSRRRVLIMGAGGRDFHNFNLLYRHSSDVEVVAFTAAQIPFQENRLYPPQLAGKFYPQGIPIVSQEDLPGLIRDAKVDEVLFSYSDVSHQHLMEIASQVIALGADFRLAGCEATMLPSRLPVISVCAVRTGCGKSAVTRFLCRLLVRAGRAPVVVRHPMAYGRLGIRAVEHFRSLADLDRYECTLEEREEFEPLIHLGVPLFAGVDYEKILAKAEGEGDVLIWDGGNNDAPFFRPDLELVLADPLRAGDERCYHPGLVNLVRARVVILNKVDQASEEQVRQVVENVHQLNPGARIIEGGLDVQVPDPNALSGKRVVVVEDGPTLTHGGMGFGAGTIAARRAGVAAVVDPRPGAVGSLREVFRSFPHLENVLPAMGYSADQLRDLSATLANIDCDLILSATPVNLAPLLSLDKPLVQVSYEFVEKPEGSLAAIIHEFIGKGS